MHFNTTSHRCTRNRSIPYWNIQQLYCYTAGWCQLVLLHQCFPDDVHNSEGDPQALHFKEIDSDCSTLLDHDSVYFCCNAIYSVNFNGGGTPEFVKSLFFIPYVRHALKSADVVRPMVGPAWTLFYDVYFTFIFGVCMKLSHKFRGLLAIAGCTMLLMIQYKFQPEHPFLFVLSQPWWISFVVGIGAFYVLQYVWDKKIAVNIKVFLGTSAAVAFAFMFLSDLNVYRNAILSGIALISLILVFRKQAMPRTINFLGKISFSFYMIHYYVILVVGRVIDLKVISVKSMCAIVFILLASIVLAGIANCLIEDKFTHFIKEKICRE